MKSKYELKYDLRMRLIKDITFYIEQKGAIGVSLNEMIEIILNDELKDL